MSSSMVEQEIANADDSDVALFVNGDYNAHGMSLEEPYPTDP